MVSLNHGNTLIQRMVEEHGFSAEQANGTLMIVDEMVDSGFDRVLASIAGLESKMDKSIAELRAEMNAQFKIVDNRFDVIDNRFDVIDNRFDVIDNRFDVFDSRFKVVDDRFDLIEKRFDTVYKLFDGVNTRVDLVDSRITERFDLLDGRMKVISRWLPIKSMGYTLLALIGLVTFLSRWPDILQMFS